MLYLMLQLGCPMCQCCLRPILLGLVLLFLQGRIDTAVGVDCLF